jgi:UDP-N-acetylglucosamine acyltransferase
MANIHPSAYIEEGATIASDVTIGAFCFVSAQARLDSGVILDHSVMIYGDTHIGEGTHIYSHAVIGSDPQDISYAGEATKMIIGKNNKIREFTLLNPGTAKENCLTQIGDNNLLMGYVHVAHDCIIGNNTILANGVTLAGHVRVGDFAVIGGLTPVHQFVHIGRNAMVGGASAVAQDIPPFCLAEGNRAMLRGVNIVGLRRAFSKEDIDALKNSYKVLFRQGSSLKDAASSLQESVDNEYVKMLCNFVLETKRGIPYERGE